MRLISIGADPELFVSDTNVPTSAIGLLGGSKYEPRMIKGYGVQEDNVLAEFSMPPVTVTGKDGADSVNFSNAVLQGIEVIESELKDRGLKATKHSSHKYTPEALKGYGPAALEFGCDPDRSAYTADWNPTPDATSTLRTAGGHIHVGYNQEVLGDDSVARMIVKAMDLYLGVPSVLIDPDNQRRELYGKAGAYRIKPYGLEYRSLSNFWIHSNELRTWAFKQTLLALANAEGINMLIGIIGEDAIQDCINTGNKELARHIIEVLNIKHNPAVEIQNAQAA